MNNGRPVIACVCGLPNKALGSAEPQAAPLVPPEPQRDHEQALGLGETLGGLLVRVQAWGRQCAEIAQAQARRADEAEALWHESNTSYYDVLAERDEARSTLAQRDREISALREGLQRIEGHTAPGNAPVNKQWVNAIANHAIASTAQAGAEAERKIKEWCVESAWKWWNDRSPERPCGRDTLEAAILGTGGEAVDLSRCPKCGGPADNGHDRCLPPNPYFCTKCESGEER